jgi:S-adenosylmethionine hydrolase
MRVITLLTDYGIRDSYVAEVKGAILRINPDVTIVDISHSVESYNVREGAFHLARSVTYFPNDSIHVAVVDPGVGGERSSIIIETHRGTLIGPDNGLLAPAAERLGVDRVVKITERKLLPPRVSDVFDGRDTFGPVASLIAKGEPATSFGPVVDGYTRIPTYTAKITDKGIEASVIHVDGFGNLVTSITYDMLELLGLEPDSMVTFEVKGRRFTLPYVRNFSSVPRREPLAVVAGGGYLEISINMGNAMKSFEVERDESVLLTKS